MKGLKIENVTFKFDEFDKDFFKNINLTFEPGIIHFIQGKNGVGKSTFFNILQENISEQTQVTGNFFLDEKLYAIHKNKVNITFTWHVKTVVQQVREMIADQFTVGQNIQLAKLNTYPGLQKLAQQKDLPEILRSCGMDLDTPVSQLSGGQKQVLAIIMALQKPTYVLLLDEPTAALDQKNSYMVMQCLQQLTQKYNLIVLMITHEPELVQKFAKGSYISITAKKDRTRIVEKNIS